MISTRRPAPDRRGLLCGASVLGFGAALSGCARLIPTDVGLALTPNPLTDPAVLNFALNLEYLEAEYYTRAVSGGGLANDMVGREPGPVAGGRQVRFSDSAIAGFASEIMQDEQAHVRFLLNNSRGSPLTEVSRPALDFQQSFRQVGAAAGLGSDFDPFSSELAFLLGAFLFEDVGVSAYTGGARLISDREVLAAAAGIQAAEAYHAGLIRSQLYMLGPRARQAADAISAARGRLSAPNPAESPLTYEGGGINVAARDGNGLTWARDPRDVLKVVYLTNQQGADRGGFFPNGVNGVVKAV